MTVTPRRLAGVAACLLSFLPALGCSESGSCDFEDSSLLALPPRGAASLEPSRLCAGHSGVSWLLAGRWHRRASLKGWSPLDVPEGGELELWLCNVGNRDIPFSEELDTAPPDLVGSVGADARVRVYVVDSFNVRLRGSLTLSEEAALVPTAVASVHPRATVKVVLSGSGNVRGTSHAATLTLRLGNLVLPVVVGVDVALESCDLHVEAKNSGNAKDLRQLTVEGGSSLVGSLVTATSVVSSKVLAKAEDSAGASDIEAVTVLGSQLLRPLARIREASASSLELSMEESAGCRCGSLAVAENGRLAWGALYSSGALTKTRVRGSLQEVAMVEAQSTNLTEGHLLQEAVYAQQGEGLDLQLRVTSSASVKGGLVHMEAYDWEYERVAVLVKHGLRMETCDFCTVQVDLRSVARLEDVEEVLMSGWAAYLIFKSVYIVKPRAVSSHSDLDLQLHQVGSIWARSVETLQWGRYCSYLVDLNDPVDFKVRLLVDQSFNARVKRMALNGQRELITYFFGVNPCVNCDVSILVTDSVNLQVEGDMDFGEQAGLIVNVYDGDLVNSSGSVEMRRSANLEVEGSLNISSWSQLIMKVLESKADKDSSFSMLLERTANIHAERDVHLGESVELISEVVEGRSWAGNLSLVLRESCNVEAGDEVHLLPSSALIEKVVDSSSTGASGGAMSLELHRVAQVKAEALIMEQAALIKEVLSPRKVSDAQLRLSVKGAATADVDRAEVNGSSFVAALHAFSGLAGSSLESALQDVAKVKADTFFFSNGSLVGAAVAVDGSISESNVSVELQDLGCVQASKVRLTQGYVLRHGLLTAENASASQLALSYRHVGSVVGEEKVSLDDSTLLGHLFDMPGRLGGSWQAHLERSASIDTEVKGNLCNGSLLGKVLSESLEAGGTEDFALYLKDTAVVCPRRNEESAKVLYADAKLCADGRRRLQQWVDGYEGSCEARYCRLKEKS